MEVSGARSALDQAPLPGCRVLLVRGQGIPKTGVFKYLGSFIGIDDTLGTTMDVAQRVGLAHAAFGKLRHAWRSSAISYSTKAKLLQSCVGPILLFGSEHLTLRAEHVRALSRAWMSFVRQCLRLSWQQQRDQRLTHEAMLSRLGVPSMLTMLQQRLATWLGHIARMHPPTRLPKVALFGTLAGRVFDSAPVARCKGHFDSRARAVLSQMCDIRIWARAAQHRPEWRRLVRGIHRCHKPGTSQRMQLTGSDPLVCVFPMPPNAPLQCPMDGCEYIARNKAGLSRHLNAKHAIHDQHFFCKFCERVFLHKGYCTTHEKRCARNPDAEAGPPPAAARSGARSSTVRNHVCHRAGCGMTCLSASQLGRHQAEQCLARPGSGARRQPDGSWMLPCPQCGALFKNSRALGVHRRRAHA